MAKLLQKTGSTSAYLADKTLSEIANSFETDKGTMDRNLLSWGNKFANNYCWHYTTMYEKYMDQVREKKIKLLEIGINDGRFPFASPKMWMQYFKDIDLYSVDNFWGSEFDENALIPILDMGMNFIYADQSSSSDWDFIENTLGYETLDFLVEDGSHYPHHVMYSLYRGANLLKSGGYYFMEDIQNPNKSRGFYGYDNATIILELSNWEKDYKTQYLNLEQSIFIKNNFDLVDYHLDPNELNYLIVFKKK